jgi:hypothetical protein
MSEMLLKVEGEGFRPNQYDLRSTEKILTNYRQIIDHLVPLTIGQKTLTDRLKSEIRYETSFKPGSLEVWLDFILPAAGVLAVAASQDGGNLLAQQLSKLFGVVIDFRRIFTDFLEKGKKPKLGINIQDQPQVTVNLKNVATGGGDINISPIILPAASSTRTAVDRLVGSVDGMLVEQLLVQSDKTETTITNEDQRIVGTQKEELPDFLEIIGRLDGVAFTAHRGSLVTNQGRFPITWEEEIRDNIKSLADQEGIVFRVRPIIDHRRFKDDPIAFHVINCWDPQARMW